MDDPRLDKVLWSVRVFKTRPLATAACRAGRVTIGGHPAKPGRSVHTGEVLQVRLGALTRTLRVLGVPPARVSAKLLPEYVVDQTPAAEIERAQQAEREHRQAHQRTAGRPTKKERRDLAELFGE
jgi:ribosome-associated heat shock protein Hsp15